jgi:hypothetical protein
MSLRAARGRRRGGAVRVRFAVRAYVAVASSVVSGTGGAEASGAPSPKGKLAPLRQWRLAGRYERA